MVHTGEWVASQKLLANPVARPLINALDYAQRTNTIGSLRSADVSKAVAPQVIVQQVPVENVALSTLHSELSTLHSELSTLHSELSTAISQLNERLNEPFVTVNTITGDNGIKKAQDEYDKLIRNKTPKSKRK